MELQCNLLVCRKIKLLQIDFLTSLHPLMFQMRFLNCRNGRKEPSKSILDVGVEAAIKFSGFDEKMFLRRGGKYVWSKADMKLDW